MARAHSPANKVHAHLLTTCTLAMLSAKRCRGGYAITADLAYNLKQIHKIQRNENEITVLGWVCINKLELEVTKTKLMEQQVFSINLFYRNEIKL